MTEACRISSRAHQSVESCIEGERRQEFELANEVTSAGRPAPSTKSNFFRANLPDLCNRRNGRTMASSRFRVSKPTNKKQREALHLKYKKESAAKKRELQFRRKKEEALDPVLREKRRARNVPIEIDHKRVWDDVDQQYDGGPLGISVEASRLKRQRTVEELDGRDEDDGTDFEGFSGADKGDQDSENEEDEIDSMLDSNSEDDEDDDKDDEDTASQQQPVDASAGATSSTDSTSKTADLDLKPEYLVSKFPTLFEPPREPKILITTSLQSTLHYEAELLTTLFPNAHYIRRNKHRFSHNFSVREIASFASNRGYTSLVILNELQKRASGIDIVHLPSGPTFHFSIQQFVEGKKLPAHGVPTNHWPELILNNFSTPLGLLTAHLFRTLFPPQPDLEGRQVVTLHNQRDYIFVRRHRYVFRDRRDTEKKVVGRDGKEMKGVEKIRVGLQELGPRLSLKLRRIDKGIQRASGQEWEWKAKIEKKRTRFQL